jgi:hypothetical protein
MISITVIDTVMMNVANKPTMMLSVALLNVVLLNVILLSVA